MFLLILKCLQTAPCHTARFLDWKLSANIISCHFFPCSISFWTNSDVSDILGLTARICKCALFGTEKLPVLHAFHLGFSFKIFQQALHKAQTSKLTTRVQLLFHLSFSEPRVKCMVFCRVVCAAPIRFRVTDSGSWSIFLNSGCTISVMPSRPIPHTKIVLKIFEVKYLHIE